MSETKYQNFEIMLMEVDVLKEELQKEIQKEQPDEAYIEEIITYGAWGDELLPILAQLGYVKGIKSLLEEGADPNVQDADGYTALMDASRQGRSQVVQELLKHPQTDPNIQTSYGFTALHWASGNGHSQAVQAILKHPKIDPNIQMENGFTALILASIGGDSQVVQALLNHPKTDITITDQSGETAWDKAGHEIRKEFPQLNPIPLMRSIIKAKDKEIEELKSLVEQLKSKPKKVS